MVGADLGRLVRQAVHERGELPDDGQHCGNASLPRLGRRAVDCGAVRDAFISSRAEIGPTDVNCPSDTFTGTDVSNCRSYVSKSIPLTDGGGNHVRVALSPFNAPLFTGSASLPFTPSVVSTQTVVATGNPAPSICVASTNLPAEIVLNGGACGVGTFNLVFNGAAGVARGRFSLTLTADNGVGSPVSKTFTIDVDEHVTITSPNRLTGTAGRPVNFLITTTGNPKPTLTIDPLVGLGGLVFRDNGDGTATISGTTQLGSPLSDASRWRAASGRRTGWSRCCSRSPSTWPSLRLRIWPLPSRRSSRRGSRTGSRCAPPTTSRPSTTGGSRCLTPRPG